MKNSSIDFYHLELTSKCLAIGERPKRGTFRPCIENIPSSTIKGALKAHFGIANLEAIGFYKEGTYEKDILTYAPLDTFLRTTKLPISIEYLKPAKNESEIIADIYVVKDNDTNMIFKQIQASTIFLGALKSKGLGICNIKYIDEIKPNIKCGYLKGRLLEEEYSNFGIERIIKPCYGYLFCPTTEISGIYKKALFEGSIIEGPEIFLKEEYLYDC